jgi:hypothetical protein
MGIQPDVRSIISSHDVEFRKNASTRAASVGVLTWPRPKADIGQHLMLQRSRFNPLFDASAVNRATSLSD